MSHYIRTFLAIGLAGCLPLSQTFGGDSKDKSAAKSPLVEGSGRRIAKVGGSANSGG